jgi:hypothetical protein
VARAAWPVLVVALAAIGSGARPSLVVWTHPMLPTGGERDGGDPTPSGAMITETRAVVAGDPGSVQLRDLRDTSATISVQRFVPLPPGANRVVTYAVVRSW